MKSSADAEELLVHRFHPLPGERAGVLDRLLADLAEHRIDGRVVLVGRLALHHAARAELLPEIRVLRIVGVFRLFLGVEVIEIAEELVEAVHRRQVLVAVAEVVLAELAGGVAEVLQELRDRRVLGLEAERGAGHADLGEAGADRRLAGDEGGAAGGAALLAVEVGEHRAFLGDAVDVGRAIAHDAVVVAADVEPADVVGHDEQDVRLVGLRHIKAPLLSLARCYLHQQSEGVGDVHGVMAISVVSTDRCAEAPSTEGHIEDDRQDEDHANRLQSCCKQPAALVGMREDGPQVGWLAGPRVRKTVTDRKQHRHRRLQAQAKREGLVVADEIRPDASQHIAHEAMARTNLIDPRPYLVRRTLHGVHVNGQLLSDGDAAVMSLVTTLSHSQLTKPLFGLLHPLHVSRATDKQQPRKDFLDEGAGLRKGERRSLRVAASVRAGERHTRRR